MDELEKVTLLNKLTIKFPVPLTAGEIERKLFGYLKSKAQFIVSYTLVIQGQKYPRHGNERYTTEIKGNICRYILNDMIESPAFTMTRDSEDHFVDLKFQNVPGHESIGEFETLPSGKEQLRLVDDIRQNLESYFSQRPKRSK